MLHLQIIIMQNANDNISGPSATMATQQTNLIDIFHVDKQFFKSNNNNVVDDWRHCKCKISLNSNKFLSIYSIYGNWAMETNHLSKFNLPFSWILFWAPRKNLRFNWSHTYHKVLHLIPSLGDFTWNIKLSEIDLCVLWLKNTRDTH